MKAEIEGYSFEFPDATSITKFDASKSHKMSQAMKAVDVVIELPKHRIYIEIKEYETNRQWIKISKRTSLKKPSSPTYTSI